MGTVPACASMHDCPKGGHGRFRVPGTGVCYMYRISHALTGVFIPCGPVSKYGSLVISYCTGRVRHTTPNSNKMKHLPHYTAKRESGACRRAWQLYSDYYIPKSRITVSLGESWPSVSTWRQQWADIHLALRSWYRPSCSAASPAC